jgi:hypothetical protein
MRPPGHAAGSPLGEGGLSTGSGSSVRTQRRAEHVRGGSIDPCRDTASGRFSRDVSAARLVAEPERLWQLWRPGFGEVQPWGRYSLMAALSRDAHRRRVLEHQAKVEADRGKPVPTPIPSSSDLQLKIRLIGEVKRSDETVEPKRGRRRSRKRTQPDLGF